MAMAAGGYPAAAQQQQRGRSSSSSRGLERNDRATLLLVATLVTTLSYQVGSNVPGGYWQDNDDGHRAGDPILRDEHYGRYVLFVWASWVGFGSSMVLTLGLLTGVAPGSRFVRWLFVVAYSTLVLTFVTSQSHTVVWANLLVWVAVMAVLAFAVTYRRLTDLIQWLCGDKHHQAADDIVAHMHMHGSHDLRPRRLLASRPPASSHRTRCAAPPAAGTGTSSTVPQRPRRDDEHELSVVDTSG